MSHFGEDNERIAHNALLERHLKRFNNFTEDHCRRLQAALEQCSVHPAASGTEKDAARTGKIKGSKTKGTSINVNNAASFVKSFGLTHNIWNASSDPISLSWKPTDDLGLNSFEQVIMSAPVPSDCNPDVAKVMLVLATIRHQMQELTSQGWNSIIQPLLLYGEGLDEDRLSMHVTEGQGHLMFSQYLERVYEMADFIDKCTELLSYCMLQLTAIFKDNKPQVVSCQGLLLPSFFTDMCHLLGLLVAMDEVISGQTLLQEHWAKYKRMIASIRVDSSAFGANAELLSRLEADMENLDEKVFSARVFFNALETVSADVRRNGVRGSTCLAETVTSLIVTWCGSIDRDFSQGLDDRKPMEVAAIFIFMSVVLPTFDPKKLFLKPVWETFKKVYCVHIGGGYLWMPDKFFETFEKIANLKQLDPKVKQAFSVARHAYLEQKVGGLTKDVLQYHVEVAQWSNSFQQTFYMKVCSNLTREDLTRRCNLILSGVNLTANISHTFRIVVNLHAVLGRPVTKAVVLNLCRLLELIKMMQECFFRFNAKVSETIPLILQNVSYIALSQVIHMKSYFVMLKDPKRTDDTRMDTIAALSVLEHAFRGHLTFNRMSVIQIAVDWTNASSRLWREGDNNGILEAAVERISKVLQAETRLQESLDCSAAYWHRIIFSSYLTSSYEQKDSSKLRLIFLVLNDCLAKIKRHSPNDAAASSRFRKEVEHSFKVNVLDKLCHDVETNLRLACHTHLRVQEGGPGGGTARSVQADMDHLRNYFDMPLLELDGAQMSVKYYVEAYLSNTFYNFASVALHDWFSYAKMRVQASTKYGLQIHNDYLPGHSLEQGLDILEIAKGINKFVHDFSYNLNNQIFIQVTSRNNYVDTINIKHMANSLRTHGPGIASTIVNTVYLFLQIKMRAFSQFLFDDQIKSRLEKEIRLFKQASELTDSMRRSVSPGDVKSKQMAYPYDRALKFHRGIRKLGVTSENFSHLDNFRMLVTHIGNALGFIRLVRSGGLNFLATECKFMGLDASGDADDITWNNGPIKSEDLDNSIQNLNTTLESLTTAVSDNVDYLKLLVQGFSEACRNPKNSHLRNFYVIVPALTLSFVDNIKACKEKLMKKSSQLHVQFTDDGFAMGIAYLLKVLDQDQDFDSLEWFNGCTSRLEQERLTAEQAVVDARKDEKLRQASLLTVKRLQDALQEFRLLGYSFSSARIFFQH